MNTGIRKTDRSMLMNIRTSPGTTRGGKPFDWMVTEKVRRGEWRLELIPAEVLGLQRPLEVYRAVRRTNLIKPWPMSDDDETYCSAHWADLAIGRGACGLRCRACFLVLTHRLFCDPSRHVLYENVEDYQTVVRKWLFRPNRKNLGLGTDSSDSLLYEGVTGHVRQLVPLFASSESNPHGCKLILLTKSTNVHYLQGLPIRNVVVTFSLNPEPIADLWEGKFDDGVRVTPSIESRLGASLRSEEMGFTVRWRVDPIFPVDEWRENYSEFFQAAAREGHAPERITLGTYREMNRTLLTFGRRWGLPPLEWKPGHLEKHGPHWHLPAEQRTSIYGSLREAIEEAWRGKDCAPLVALCKEPRSIRRAVGLDHERCNCE